MLRTFCMQEAIVCDSSNKQQATSNKQQATSNTRQGDKATRRQGDKATRRQGDKATRRQGDKATRRQGDKATRRQGDKRQATSNSNKHQAPLTKHHSPSTTQARSTKYQAPSTRSKYCSPLQLFRRCAYFLRTLCDIHTALRSVFCPVTHLKERVAQSRCNQKTGTGHCESFEVFASGLKSEKNKE